MKDFKEHSRYTGRISGKLIQPPFSVPDIPDTPTKLNGPVIDLCDIALAYAGANRSKAARVRALGSVARADELDGSALIIEQLVNVLRTLSDLISDVGTSEDTQDDPDAPRLPL